MKPKPPRPELTPVWLGRQPYAATLTRQHQRREQVLAGTAPEAVWLVEHDPPVVTVGRRVAEGVPSPAFLAEKGVGYVETRRGGLATWHGPGQLVIYLIVDVYRRRLGVKGLFCQVEQAIIDWLAAQGIEAGRRSGYPGVWVGRDKVCAVGMHFRRGVSMHGLALNLCPRLEDGFGLIVPCGIGAEEGGVTSVAALTGAQRAPEVVWEEVGQRVVEKI